MADGYQLHVSVHPQNINRIPHLHGMKYSKEEDQKLKEWVLQKPNPGSISIKEWRLFAQVVS